MIQKAQQIRSLKVENEWENIDMSISVTYGQVTRSSTVVVVVVTLSLPRNRGTTRTAIHVYAVSLIELSLGKGGSSFRTSHE